MTFIFEQGLLLDSRGLLDHKFWACVEKAHKSLGWKERGTNADNQTFPLKPHRKDSSSRESLWMHIQATADETKYPGLPWCFILHCEALPLIPLRNRSIGSQRCNKGLKAHLLEDLLPKLFSLIESYLSEWNLDLDIDGNIFAALLGILLADPALPLPQLLGDSLSRIAISVKPPSDDPPHLIMLSSTFPVRLARSKPLSLPAAPKKLLPFHHDVFDEGFSLIDTFNDSEEEEDIEYGALEFGKDTAFNDKYHWHNAKRQILPKHLGGEQAKPSDDWQRMKMLRRQQRFMSRLTTDAATLTGALGARFNRLTIVTGGTKETRTKDSGHPVRCGFASPSVGKLMYASKVKGHKKPGKKEKPMSSKEKLLAEIAAKKSKRDADEQREWWEGRLKEFRGTDLDADLRTLSALERNPRTSGGWLRDEVLLYRLHLTISKWIAQTSDQDAASVCDHYTVAIMRIIKELLESRHLTLTIHGKISTILTVLGFENFLTPPPGSQSDRPLCFKFVKLVRSKSDRPLYEFMRITEDPITWQLRLYGEYMDRSIDSKPDTRVSFTPDAWQREVLDSLDKNESILVVGGCTRRVSLGVIPYEPFFKAPTSAGKTFISFYAMEQVLRGSDDGVLVYVAPTKALVTQVAAEIYARFSKDLKNGEPCQAISNLMAT